MTATTSALDLNKLQRSLSPAGSEGSPRAGARAGKIPTKPIFKKKPSSLWADSVARGGGSFITRKKPEDYREDDRATTLAGSHTHPSTKDSPFSPGKAHALLASPAPRAPAPAALGHSAPAKKTDADLKIVLDPAKDALLIQQLRFPHTETAQKHAPAKTLAAVAPDPGPKTPSQPLLQAQAQGTGPAPATASSTLSFGQRRAEQRESLQPEEPGRPVPLPQLQPGAGQFPVPGQPQSSSQQADALRQPRRAPEARCEPISASPLHSKEEIARLCSSLPTGLLDLDSLVLVKQAPRRPAPEPLAPAEPPGPVPQPAAQALACAELRKRERPAGPPQQNALASLESALAARRRAQAWASPSPSPRAPQPVPRPGPVRRPQPGRAAAGQTRSESASAGAVCVRVNYNNQTNVRVSVPARFVLETGTAGGFLESFLAAFVGRAAEPGDAVLTCNLKRLARGAPLAAELLAGPAAFEVYLLGPPPELHARCAGLHSLPPAELLEQLLKTQDALSVLGFSVGNQRCFVRWDRRAKLGRGFALHLLVEERPDGSLILSERAWNNQLPFFHADCKKVSTGYWAQLVQVDRLFG